jgi:subtilisin family serine protease
VVAAAGNEGNQAWHYITAPADVNGDSLIAVGAVDLNGTPASFSSYGPSADGRVKPDLAACGVNYPLVSGSSNPNAYTTEDGTSFATPTLAGLAACVMSARPQWTARQVILALRSSGSTHLSPDNRVGYGIPNGPLALDSTVGVPGGPAPRLSLRLLGANPVVLSHGPAFFEFAAGAEMVGRSATLRVFDSQGRRVRELWSGVVTYPALLPSTSWDGRDDDGRAVASGLYIVDLRAGDEHVALRLAALR